MGQATHSDGKCGGLHHVTHACPHLQRRWKVWTTTAAIKTHTAHCSLLTAQCNVTPGTALGNDTISARKKDDTAQLHPVQASPAAEQAGPKTLHHNQMAGTVGAKQCPMQACALHAPRCGPSSNTVLSAVWLPTKPRNGEIVSKHQCSSPWNWLAVSMRSTPPSTCN